MRSKHESECNLCEETIRAGAPGARFLGQWVHEECKAEKVAAIAAEGRRSTLPEARGWVDMEEHMNIKNRDGVRHHRMSYPRHPFQ